MNFHLYPSSFKNESRIEKISQSISKCNIFSSIILIGTNEHGTPSSRKISENVEVKLFGITNRHYKILGKVLVFIIWYFSVLWYLRSKSVKCVNAHSLSCLPLGIIIKLISGCKLVYDTHELETETKSQKGLRKGIAKFIEKNCIGYVDQTFVVSESIASWYEEQYCIHRPTVVLNVPFLSEELKSNYFREKFGIRASKKIIIYQGDLSYGRGVEIILNCFLKKRNDSCVVIFMGDGDLREKIISASNASDSIFFHDFVSPKDILRYTSSADIGVSLIENTCLSYYYCLPNKFFEYAMAGLPVIVSNVVELSKIVNLAKNGVVSECIGERCFDDAIEEILNLDLVQLGINSRKIAEKNCWDIQEVKIFEIYKEKLFKLKRYS
jgi:glycosyltransferase involved in cell wall biosynthesis